MMDHFTMRTLKKAVYCLVVLLLSVFFAGNVQAAKAGNDANKGIFDTRHNLSQSFDSIAEGAMGSVRNNYGEVCVYCHTPHGANITSGTGMPLWNRTVNTSLTYNLYDKPTTELGPDQTVTHPGPASLTCLSCHDGVTAIDSIINMPGSGGYNKDMESISPEGAAPWLTSEWTRLSGSSATVHSSLSTPGCISCHDESLALLFNDPSYDFRIFSIGNSFTYDGATRTFNEEAAVDLRDDHPVGVLYPSTFGPEVDFHEPDVQVPGRYAFFEQGAANQRADKFEVRLYDSGGGYEVECASCHDPHGVPDSTGDIFIPSFLRVENTGSTLCLVCHDK